jgi:hypothetical protein
MGIGEDDPIPDSLSTFVDRKDPSEWSVQLINPAGPEPVRSMAESLFGSLDEEMQEAEIGGLAEDLLLVIRDSEVVASSPLERIKNTLLLVNSDLYTTGTRSIDEITIPDTVQTLSDEVFTLTGYPEANTEKLVLTLVSRHVEQQAANSQTGTLKVSFQRLSRLDDERGTREVYKTLGQKADLDIHVYGFPDWNPPSEMGLTVHPVRDDEIRNTWFVVYSTDTGTDKAMLAVKDGPNTWKGYWTSNTPEIRAIDEYISQSF